MPPTAAVRLPRPVLLCAALALAGHAAVLGVRPAHEGSTAQAAPPHLLHVNLVKPEPAPQAVLPAQEAAAEASVAAPEIPEPPKLDEPRDVITATAPALAASLPEVGLPDALLPQGGVEVHVFASVGANGEPVAVATAAWPANETQAYSDIARNAVQLLRFEPGESARSYCLQLDFKPNRGEPIWSWRPDGARQAVRCLNSKAPAAQPLQAP